MGKNEPIDPDQPGFDVADSPSETARFGRVVKRYTLTGDDEWPMLQSIAKDAPDLAIVRIPTASREAASPAMRTKAARASATALAYSGLSGNLAAKRARAFTARWVTNAGKHWSWAGSEWHRLSWEISRAASGASRSPQPWPARWATISCL